MLVRHSAYHSMSPSAANLGVDGEGGRTGGEGRVGKRRGRGELGGGASYGAKCYRTRYGSPQPPRQAMCTSFDTLQCLLGAETWPYGQRGSPTVAYRAVLCGRCTAADRGSKARALPRMGHGLCRCRCVGSRRHQTVHAARLQERITGTVTVSTSQLPLGMQHQVRPNSLTQTAEVLAGDVVQVPPNTHT